MPRAPTSVLIPRPSPGPSSIMVIATGRTCFCQISARLAARMRHATRVVVRLADARGALGSGSAARAVSPLSHRRPPLRSHLFAVRRTPVGRTSAAAPRGRPGRASGLVGGGRSRRNGDGCGPRPSLRLVRHHGARERLAHRVLPLAIGPAAPGNLRRTSGSRDGRRRGSREHRPLDGPASAFLAPRSSGRGAGPAPGALHAGGNPAPAQADGAGEMIALAPTVRAALARLPRRGVVAGGVGALVASVAIVLVSPLSLAGGERAQQGEIGRAHV